MNLCIRFNKILLLTTITSIFIYVILEKYSRNMQRNWKLYCKLEIILFKLIF